MPDVPPDHPALGSIGMNVAMSMLGLDNGALPSGLKAMQELEQLNTRPGTASRAQQMFLVYMTTSITIFPISILSFRIQAGAAQPADVFVPLLLASYVGLFVGLAYMAVRQGIRLLDPVLLGVAMLLVTALCGLAWGIVGMPSNDISSTAAVAGNASLLLSVVLFVTVAWWRGVPVYDAFLKGASKGFSMAIDLIPYLVGMLVAIGLLRTSGAFALLEQALGWLCTVTGLDARWALGVPQAIMKAFSGKGANAMMLDTFKTHGADSFVGHLSSIIQGASDTTFYILAACAGAAKLKNLGSAVAGAVLASTASFLMAVACTLVFFG
jgi:spore maturation protein SpmB